MSIFMYSLASGLCIGAAAGAWAGWVVCVPIVVVSIVLGFVAEHTDD